MEFRITDTTGGVEEDGFVISEPRRPNPRNSFTAKRALDIMAASLGLIFVAPLLLIVALMVRLQDGQAAIFSHTRYGQHGRTFKCYKLRSMVPDAAERLQALLDSNPEAKREWELTQKLTHDPRITPLGRCDDHPQDYPGSAQIRGRLVTELGLKKRLAGSRFFNFLLKQDLEGTGSWRGLFLSG
ncbi:sugar transferase [Hyphomonas polymorpha PS728]|uniref:Sugar transferase n=1 Tax=Hyphomonas polymorpha PS728 TaxID=1280954 RepID=A0A062VEL9_9PROT|nr:sugar transferase [Hyphomonas polymorpha]KCZ97864.1 sugar transferase [Hyphomonas polymorpha PS728]